MLPLYITASVEANVFPPVLFSFRNFISNNGSPWQVSVSNQHRVKRIFLDIADNLCWLTLFAMGGPGRPPPILIVDLLLIAPLFAYKFFWFFLTYAETQFSAYKTFVYYIFGNSKTTLKLGRNQSFLYFRLSVILIFNL